MLDLETELASDTLQQQEIYAKNVDFIQKLCRKYFQMGQMTSSSSSDLVKAALDEVDAVLKECRDAQLLIESNVEDAGLKEMHDKYDSLSAWNKQLVGEFQDLTDKVDHMNGPLIAVKNQKLAAIRKKYVPEA